MGDRIGQAQQTYETALNQLSRGSGNLLRQAEMLKELGARNTKQIDTQLAEQAIDAERDPDGEIATASPEKET